MLGPSAKGLRWGAVAVALAAVSLATGDSRAEQQPRAARERAAHTQKGASRMQPTIRPTRAEVIVGGSIPVEVTLVNHLAAAAEAPSPDSPSVFEYILRSARDGQPRLSLTRRRALAARSDDTMPGEPLEMVRLDPGAALTYEEDIADYAVTPIPPGQYLLSVAYQADTGRVESPGAPLSVVAPRVRSLAAVAAPSGRLGLAILDDTGGRTRVFQRESNAATPGDGVWHERTEGQAQAASAVAVAGELAEHRGVRWFAWLQGDAIAAGVGQNRTLFLLTNPLPLGLRSPRLQDVGWQRTTREASFAALGLNAQGRVAFAVASLQDNGRGSVNVVPLGAAAMPARWAARLSSLDLSRFDVVAAVHAGAVVRLQRQSVTVTTGVAEAAVTLAERGEPLAAMALSPLTGEAEVVDVLFGPVGPSAQMTFARLRLGGGPPVAEWKFDAPLDESQQRPTVWALAPTPLPDPVVAVKSGDKLFARRAASKAGWKTLAEGAVRAEHLRLEVAGGRTWAVWADPGTGITYKPADLP